MEADDGMGSGVVPDSVMEAVKRTSANIQQFRDQFVDMLPLFDSEVLAEMPPLERAQSLLLLAKATTSLFTLKLRCKGIQPDEHPVKSEIERVRLYQEKLERLTELNKAPLRPSATLNYQAATRFIEHSLPGLTPEQKLSMRNIRRGEGVRTTYPEKSANKRRKYQSYEKQSVRTAAQEFLEKAARELLGDKDGLKGPVVIDSGDKDDLKGPVVVDSGDKDGLEGPVVTDSGDKDGLREPIIIDSSEEDDAPLGDKHGHQEPIVLDSSDEDDMPIG